MNNIRTPGVGILNDSQAPFGRPFERRLTSGDIEITVCAEEIGQDLADRVGLVETKRKTSRSNRPYASQDTRELTHIVVWAGTVAGHQVELSSYTYSPLGDLDLAEGEELA